MEDLPWLYYSAASESVIQTNEIDFTMSFTGNDTNTSNKVSQLPFYLIQYDVSGSVRRFTKLGGDFLLCPHSVYENTLSVMYGVQYKVE